MSISDTPILTSLRLYDSLRLNAENVIRETGSNVDIFTIPGSESSSSSSTTTSTVAPTAQEIVDTENSTLTPATDAGGNGTTNSLGGDNNSTEAPSSSQTPEGQRALEQLDEAGETIGLCHLSSIFPFTRRDFVPSEGAFEEAAAAMLAMQHLNTGDGSLVAEVEGLNERCKIRFTTEFRDTTFVAGVALGHVVEQTNRIPGGPERLPCAYLGAVRSSVSMPTSLVTGLLGYPQISSSSTSADLDDVSQFPLFARTVPSDQGGAVPIIIFLRRALNIKHLAIINVNDAYGNAYVEGMREAAELYAPDMVLHQIPLDEDQVEAAIANLKTIGYRYVFALVFTTTIHDALLTEAYNQDVAGNGKHNWLFGDSFGQVLVNRQFEVGSPLHQAYKGVGLLQGSGGVAGVPAYDKFVEKVSELRNTEDLEYMGKLWPTHDHPNYGTKPPFIDDPDFLNGEIRRAYAPFMYEAVIAMGLSACEASQETLSFNGVDHYGLLKNTTFQGISGQVVLDPVTGTRDPSTALYKVDNYIDNEVLDENGNTVIEFSAVNTDLFLQGNWTSVREYIFNDGTSTLQPDLPPPVIEEPLNLALIIALPVAILFVTGILLFLFYENKRQQNDSVWKVQREELKFQDPPVVIGRGAFGVVLMAEYRGTQVAVKRVIPPKDKKKNGRMSGSLDSTNRSDFDDSGDHSESSYGGRDSVGMASMAKQSRATISVVGKSMISGQKTQAAPTHRSLKAEFMEEMRYLAKLRHPCVTTVMGAVIGKGVEPMLIMEYMDHGSLYDLLHNETMALEAEILLPILRDITQGMRFLHSAVPQLIHGDLKAQNILVDNRFRAKVADFGLSQKQNLGGTGTPFFMAPELLRGESMNTTSTDVYAFGIILYEVYSRKDPYDGEDFEEVLSQIADPKVGKRPPPPRHMPDQMKGLMKDCVDEDATARPSFEELDVRVKRVHDEPNKSKKKDVQVSLFDIFPKHIAEALRDGHTVEAEHKECVTIFFSDIVGFTNISSELDPRKVATMLDRLYTKFDALSQKHDIFKVETIGDAYMAVTNLVKDQEEDHAKRIAEFSVDAIKAANETLIDLEDDSKGFVNIRVGFHSGPVVADVVGTRNPRYCLFGDSVNTASRMESNSKVNRIHCSKSAAKVLSEQMPEMKMKSRGTIPIKGKGNMETYWVNESGPRAAPSVPRYQPDNQMYALTEGSSEFDLVPESTKSVSGSGRRKSHRLSISKGALGISKRLTNILNGSSREMAPGGTDHSSSESFDKKKSDVEAP